MIPRVVLALVISVTGVAAAAQGPGSPSEKVGSSCISCHGQQDGELAAPVEGWKRDVHADAGLGCEACHGGDPSLRTAEDAEASMSPAKGFRPPPDRLRIAGLCAGCHSDAEFMKQYDPQARVDQLAEYRTSVHGKLNAGGDPVPATCTDCHSAHGVRAVDSPDSPVYATNVPETCARCHADASVMEAYGTPTDQHAKYLESVHAAALLERGDTAAPACNDCHGNHGASPPGVESVARVCGQCHGLEAKLFRSSFKKQLFDEMEVPECSVCHGNHRITHPTPEVFHSGSGPSVSKGTVTSKDPLIAQLGDLQAGEDVEATWAIILDPHLKAGKKSLRHQVRISAEDMEPQEIDVTIQPGSTIDVEEPFRVSSDRLSASLFAEPVSGSPVAAGDTIRLRLEVRADGAAPLRAVQVQDIPGDGSVTVSGSVCLACHETGDDCDRATGEMYVAILTMDRELREAEGQLHRAAIAGMDVSEAVFGLKSGGRTAAVEARALIHSFDAKRLIARAEDAKGAAGRALGEARAALAELRYRRNGLAVALFLIALVLLGLYLKIRDLDRRRMGKPKSAERSSQQ